MISIRTLVCVILCTKLWCSASNDLYSFYSSANNFWDFDRSDDIVDNITSRKSHIRGTVSTTRSPAGTGLLVQGGLITLNKYNPAGEEDGNDPVGCLDPATCTEGFTVSVFIKVIGTDDELQNNIFLFGNRIDESYKGWSVGILDKKLQVFVATNEYVCSFTRSEVMANVWFHLGFTWWDPKLGGSLEVFVDSDRFHNHKDISCLLLASGERLLNPTVIIKSVSITVEYDNLAIWQTIRPTSNMKASWEYILEHSLVPIDVTLDVALIDRTWNIELGDPESPASRSILEAFENQMANLNNSDDSVAGNILTAKLSNFSQHNNTSVAATMYLRFHRSTWEALLQLQEAFENKSLLNSRITILNCSATDDSFCSIPNIYGRDRWPDALRVYFHYLGVGHTGLIYGYTIIVRKVGSLSWKVGKRRAGTFGPSWYGDVGYLKPFTNYSVRVFPYSFLGYRLGSEPKIFQTAEKGPDAAPNISNLFNTSSTSLLVTWLHDIPPEMHNGILIGYQVRWQGPGSSSSMLLGLHANSYNITGLNKYTSYNISVAGRTNGGVGVERQKTVMTDEDIPSEAPVGLTVTANSITSLLVQWNQVRSCCRHGIIRGYVVLLADHELQQNISYTSANETTFSMEFNNLLPYYAYSVSVAAFTVKGNGPASQKVNLTGEGAPVNPANVSAWAKNSTSISVQWSFDNSPRNVLGVLRGFRVRINEQYGGNPSSVTVAARDLSRMLTNLKPHTEYNVTVGAFTLAGETKSTVVRVRTLQDVPGAPPSNVSTYNISSTAIRVLWGPMPAALENGIILGFHLILMQDLNVKRNLTVSPRTREMVVTNLTKYTTYQVSLSGFTVIGSGVQSVPLSVTTNEDVPSSAPNVAGVMLSSTSIQVTIQPLPSEFVHGILRGYKMIYERVDQHPPTVVERILQVNQPDVQLTDLNEFTNYSVQVSAFTSKGHGPSSAPFYVMTDEDVPASPPLNLIANSSFTEIQLSWQPVTPDDVNGMLLGYKILYRQQGTVQWTEHIVPHSALGATLASLSEYTDYEIQILGYNSKGQGAASPILNRRTKDVDDCKTGRHNCSVFSECINTLGAFRCACQSGFAGDGDHCTDINECKSSPCLYQETCINGDGSFFCLKITNAKDDSSCTFGSLARILDIDKNVNTATELRKVEHYLFTTEVNTKCSGLSFEWKVANVTSLPFTVGTAYFTTVGLDSEWSDISSLDFGIYLVEFIVYFQDFYFLDYGFINVLPSPPVAIIAGGSEVSRKHNSVITLDASSSYDLDLGPGIYERMTFAWSCSDISGEGCFGSKEHRLDETGRMVSLDTSAMQINQHYDIKLTVIENGMNSSFVQRILVTGDPLYAEMNCIINCGFEVNPTVKVSVTSNCTNPSCHKENVQLIYSWTLFIQSTLNSSWTRVDELKKMTRTALNSSSLVVYPNMLLPGRNYRLKVALDKVKGESSSGFSAWRFTTFSVPRGGVRSVNTPSGVAMQETFTLSCTGWEGPNQPFLYEFMVTLAQGTSTILSYGYSSVAEITLPPGDPSKNYSLTIDAYIISSTGSRAKTAIEVQVLPWPLLDTKEVSDEIRRLLSGSFASLIDRGDLRRATQLAFAILRSLELQGEEIISKEDRTQIKSIIISLLSKVDVRDLRKLIQASSVMSLAMEDPLEITSKAQQLLMEMLQNMTTLLESVAARGNAADVPYIEIAENNLVYALGKELQVSWTWGDQLQSSLSGYEANKLREQTLKSLELIRRVLRTIAKSNVIGEVPTMIHTDAMDALFVRLQPDEVAGSLLNLQTGSVQFPDDFTEIGEDFVDIEVTSSPVNYYFWDSSATSITTPVLSIVLRGKSGEVIPVNNLLNDIQLVFQHNEQSAQNEAIVEAPLFLKPGKMRFHTIDVTQERASYLLTVTTKENVKVFVKRGSRPSVEDHAKNYTIPDFSFCTKDIDKEEYNCSRNPHQVLLRDDVLNGTGVYYLGILYPGNVSSGNHFHRTRRSCFYTHRQKRSCVETKDPPPPLGEYVTAPFPPYDPLTDLNYTIDTEELSCKFWSEGEQKWVTEGCKVGPGSTKHRLLCLCNHLTSFGGGLLVAPNPIDVDVVFKELARLHETGNFGVLLTIIFVYVLYFFAVVLAKRADRRDQDKHGPRVVLDTEEDADLLSNQYEMTVSTGVWHDSGTTAKVTMVLYGSSGSSGKIAISPDMDPSQTLLSRGSIDKFIIPLSRSLETLKHAYIWHDNSGDSPSWFLDYVIVRDKEANKEWKMVCNKWFSPDKDDGSIFRKLLVERKNSRLPNFKEAFRSKLSGSLFESHVWMSSVTKRPRDSFTRSQRVTCCLCVVFTAMLANAMFYNVGGEVESRSIRLGPLKVSVRQIIITMQSCLVIAPINLLIVVIFKNSRPTVDKHCCQRPRNKESQDVDESGEKPLHHIFVYIAWFVCFVVAITSSLVVFFYSLMWGKDTANEWLSSILMSITLDILAIQPVRLIILSAVTAIITTKARKTKAKLTAKEGSAHVDDEGDDEAPVIGNVLPDPRQLEWYKKYRMDEAKTMSVFRSLTFFIAFLVVLAVVCYGNRDYHNFIIAQEARALLLEATEVGDTLAFWAWMINIFTTGVYVGNWYNGDEEANKVYISDKSSILVGMPRIRQLRVRKEACPVPMVVGSNVTEICSPPYSKNCEDKTPMYLPKWKSIPANASPSSFKKLCPKPWRYRRSEEMGNLVKTSPRASYGGGGYVADLGYDIQTARRVVEDLSGNKWIDERTRAAIVEFSTFNINTNILVVGNYFFEFLPTGGVFSHVKVEILQLYGTATSFAQLVLLFRLLLIVMVVVYLVIEAVKLFRQKGSYFKNICNWLSIVLIITSVTAVVLHIIGEQTTKNTIKELQKNVYATVSFHQAIRLLDIETVFLAVVVFLATVKLLSLLRFSKQIIFLSITVRFAGRCLASFSIIFIIIFLSFAMCGMLAFGNTVESYSSFLRVCVSHFEFLLGRAVPNMGMAKVDPFLAFLFSSLYICSMTILFLNVFIAILNTALVEVKDNLDAVADELDLADFIVAYLTQGLVNMFRKKKRNKSKLYCENMTFEDECSYMEDCLGEIDRRVSTLADDPLSEDCVRLMKARLGVSCSMGKLVSPKALNRKDTDSMKVKPEISEKTTDEGAVEEPLIYKEIDNGPFLEELLSIEEIDYDAPSKDPLSEEDLWSFYSSENVVIMDDISNPLYSTAVPTAISDTDIAHENTLTTSTAVTVGREKVNEIVKSIELGSKHPEFSSEFNQN